MRRPSWLQGARLPRPTAPSRSCAGTRCTPRTPQAAAASRVLALRLPCGRGAGRGAGHRQRHQLLVPRPKACPSLSGATGPLRTAKQSSCCHVARAVGGTRSAWWGQPRDDVRTHVYASKSPLLMASISCSVTLMISCFRARGKDRAGEDGAGATGSPARGEGGGSPARGTPPPHAQRPGSLRATAGHGLRAAGVLRPAPRDEGHGRPRSGRATAPGTPGRRVSSVLTAWR